MLFNSFAFLLFLPIVIVIYYLLPHRGQNWFLLFASCFFYACWDWRFLAPLLLSTSIDYWCATRMEDLIEKGRPIEARKPYLVLSLVTNLGLLGFFKYFGFFTGSMVGLLGKFGLHPSVWTLRVILPVGISFYTFQALSYTIDVYRGELHATRKFHEFLLAVLYFPHLVAGPIQRANNLLPQVVNPRRTSRLQVSEGLSLMIAGYFKKVFIADNLAPIVNGIFAEPHPRADHVVLAAYAFAVQIYCDFSGYTDIARGVAKLMGFEFMLNFNLPYLATNPREFWSRWHISLSTWLRDYLYIPLGGNRDSEWRTCRNLFLTMVIGGLWHGANWTFVIWGAYHGALLIGHRLLTRKSNQERVSAPAATSPQPLWLHWIKVAAFFQLTALGWLIFRADSFKQLASMLASLFHPTGFDLPLAWKIFSFALPLILVQMVQYATDTLNFVRWSWFTLEVRALAYSILLYFVLFRGGRPESFIYFQF
jgi:D-alanyl-lipoteichoic acid acyltransferase DltB (MBOAT superfamily)